MVIMGGDGVSMEENTKEEVEEGLVTEEREALISIEGPEKGKRRIGWEWIQAYKREWRGRRESIDAPPKRVDWGTCHHDRLGAN